MSKRLISDFFCVATSGPTVDGREMKADWLEDMAETYSSDKYQARLWPDHVRWYGAWGDVVDVRAEKDGDTIKYYNRIAPNPTYQRFIQDGQLVFPSVEIVENFARSGKAYQYGLGMTDSPASLSTDRIQFHANCAGQSCLSQEASGKPQIFTFAEAIPADLKLEEEKSRSFFDFGGLFSRAAKPDESKDTSTTDTTEQESYLVTEQDKNAFKELMTAGFAAFKKEMDAELDQRFSALKPEEAATGAAGEGEATTEATTSEAPEESQAFKELQQKFEELSGNYDQLRKDFDDQEIPTGAARDEVSGEGEEDGVPEDFC